MVNFVCLITSQHLPEAMALKSDAVNRFESFQASCVRLERSRQKNCVGARLFAQGQTALNDPLYVDFGLRGSRIKKGPD
jgi:hypothetical protein